MRRLACHRRGQVGHPHPYQRAGSFRTVRTIPVAMAPGGSVTVHQVHTQSGTDDTVTRFFE